MLALGVSSCFLNLIGLRAIDATLIGKEQQPVVSCGHKEVRDNIVSSKRGSLNTLATAVLAAVIGALGSLDVTTAGDGDNHLFFGN